MVFQSNILKEGKLVSYDEWSNYIDSLKTDISISNEKKAVEILGPLLEKAVKNRVPKEKFGIFFSGGIDSSFIAYLCEKITLDFVCYTVGIGGSKDIAAAKMVAEKHKLKHKIRLFTLKEMESLFEKTAKILGKDLINIVNIGVGAVEIAAIEMAKQDKINILFSGLGSEEIFAGYQRHEKAENINKECWSGLKTMWGRDFQRDYKIASNENVIFLTPFLDKDLIKGAMQVDGSLKIKEKTKKYILRKTAEASGLDMETAFRPKIAAQYGSNFDRAIEKITKSKGYMFKKEYLNHLMNLTK